MSRKDIDLIESACDLRLIGRDGWWVRESHHKKQMARVWALNAELTEALRQLYDEQDGPPIARRMDKWAAAMGTAQVALERAEKERGS